MPGRFDPPEGSRWSSERERLERERQQKEFDAKRPTPPRRSSWREGASHAPDEPAAASPIRERRGSSDIPDAGDIRPATVGRRWRDSVNPSPPDDGGSSLPPLPGDDGGSSRGGGSGKGLLIFGAILFLLMAVLAFTPIGPLGSDGGDGGDPTEPVIVVPTSPSQDPDARGEVSTPPPRETLADAEYVVCIDPGHGGWDPGWERLDQGAYAPPYFNESEINLAMALMLRDELESRGIGVVMTRETGTAANVYGEDVNGDGRTILDGEQHGDRDELQRRIDTCNEAGADVLVSLHLNGFDDPAARGYEVLYTSSREFGDRNLDLATAIYRAVGSAFDDVGFETQARGTKDDQRDLNAETHEFGSEQHFVLTGPAVNNPDYTIVPSEMPGVFVEPVFVSNQDDANFIVNPDNQRLLAEAYANGIEAYLEQHPE